MTATSQPNGLDLHRHLPPYRSLLTPHARYDYRIHSLVPMNVAELSSIATACSSLGTSGGYGTSGAGNSAKIKMKYKLLLSDVSRRTSMILLKIEGQFRGVTSSGASIGPLHRRWNPPTITRITQLPPEMLTQIFLLLEWEDLKCTLLVCRSFYQMTKPLLYAEMRFTLSYKFHMFVTYLRLNPAVGHYVRSLDLQALHSSGSRIDESDELIPPPAQEPEPFAPIPAQTPQDGPVAAMAVSFHESMLAGWRDWKFRNNSLYALHALNLTKTQLNSSSSVRLAASASSSLTRRRRGLSRIFPKRSLKGGERYGSLKRLKSSTLLSKGVASAAFDSTRNGFVSLTPQHPLASQRRIVGPHPTMNKLLLNYLLLRDVPVGAVLHVLALCPNLQKIDLGNLLLLVDYEVAPEAADRFSSYDLAHNYPRDMCSILHQISRDLPEVRASNGPTDAISLLLFSLISSAALVKQRGTEEAIVPPLTVKTPKNYLYQLLLPPLPNLHPCTTRGDRKVYLLDLNLKSVNANYLLRVQESELLTKILQRQSSLQYLSLLRMIWLTKLLVLTLLRDLLRDVPMYASDDSSTTSTETELQFSKKNLVIDLTDSGMYKNLSWAVPIDLNTSSGRLLASRIVRGSLLEPSEYRELQDRLRRGRIGENYWGARYN